MLPKRTNHRQGRLFEQRLSDQLNPHNELALLASYIKWDALEKEFVPFFDKEDGKPAKPDRLITGIMILQQNNNFSLLPDSIGELKQLKELYVMNNKIQVLP